MPENAKLAIVEDRRARGRPRSDDLADLEARLIRVARQRFIANGYRDTSMNEIAHAARVSKGTLYSRFTSKEALFTAIVEKHFVRARIALAPVQPLSQTLEANLVAYVVRGLKFNAAAGNIELNRLIFSEAPRLPEISRAFQARTRVVVKHVSDMMEEYAVIDGIPNRHPDLQAELLLTLVRGYLVEVVHREQLTLDAEINEWAVRAVSVFMASRPNW